MLIRSPMNSQFDQQCVDQCDDQCGQLTIKRISPRIRSGLLLRGSVSASAKPLCRLDMVVVVVLDGGQLTNCQCAYLTLSVTTFSHKAYICNGQCNAYIIANSK